MPKEAQSKPTSEAKPKKTGKKEEEPIVYSKLQTIGNTGEEKVINLTKKDLDWRNDPLLRKLFFLDIEIPPEYAGIRAVRALRQYVAKCENTIDHDYQASRKLGRL